MRANWLPITCLVLAAVGLTTVAVATIARLLVPDLPWAAAVALGAIVAPPDATAAVALLRQVKLPYRIANVLEGEGLLNDASALFVYRLAVGAVAVGGAGGFSIGTLATAFVLVVPLSLAAGIGLSYLSTFIIDAIDDPPSSIIMQFAFTFGVWMLAESCSFPPC